MIINNLGTSLYLNAVARRNVQHQYPTNSSLEFPVETG